MGDAALTIDLRLAGIIATWRHTGARGRGVLSSSRLETDVVDSRPQWTAIVHTCEAEPHGLPLPLRKIDRDSSRLAPVCIAW